MASLSIVVLAAGQGKRMRSAFPKVLHTIGDKPFLGHVIDTAKMLEPSQCVVVYGYHGDQIQNAFSKDTITWVEQPMQKGTGDAVMKALPTLSSDRVLILYGDVPLLTISTLQRLLEATPVDGLGLLTAAVADPTGLGRIVRDKNNNVIAIIEEKDADLATKAIQEINSGIMVVPKTFLEKALPQLTPQNAQGEYYLTDIIAIAVKQGIAVTTTHPDEIEEILGVNDRAQQAQLERFYQLKQARHWLAQGVEIKDPHRFDLRGTLDAQGDVTLDVGVVFEGHTVLRQGCRVGPHCVIINSDIGEGAVIRAHSYLENATVGKRATVGPFARIRPGAVLDEDVHVGNFVEIKNSIVGKGSKISHLSYIGDAIIGRDVNIGAGTITCNYDGVNKHQTIIEDSVHVGSDTQLVAPVRIGIGATLGAGSTVTKDVPAYQLTLTHHLVQRSEDWQRPVKPEKQKE